MIYIAVHYNTTARRLRFHQNVLSKHSATHADFGDPLFLLPKGVMTVPVTKELLAQEAQAMKWTDDVLKRHFPKVVNKPIVVYFKAMPGMNLQGIHYYNGSKHYLILNQDFAGSPLLELLLAHELGHVIDETKHFRWQDRLLYFLKQHNICGNLHLEHPAKEEICSDWFCLLTGLTFAKEWAADSYTFHILEGEGIRLEMYRALINYPRKPEPLLSAILNQCVRFLSLLHVMLRTRC